MKPQHTPGPWTAFRTRFTEWGVKSSGGPFIEQLGEPNARLIAAAPDLLAALKLLMDSPEPHDRNTGWFYQQQAEFQKATRAARAAIEKVEGGA